VIKTFPLWGKVAVKPHRQRHGRKMMHEHIFVAIQPANRRSEQKRDCREFWMAVVDRQLLTAYVYGPSVRCIAISALILIWPVQDIESVIPIKWPSQPDVQEQERQRLTAAAQNALQERCSRHAPRSEGKARTKKKSGKKGSKRSRGGSKVGVSLARFTARV
jgi:hypothetical protein